MPRSSPPGLLFLHALPLDGSMWASYRDLLPGASYAPTLYGLGDSIGSWATRILGLMRHDRLILVGCSIGGSCALEVAARAPERVAALVLIGTKAKHRPDPALEASALDLILGEGIDLAWSQLWAPLFSKFTDEDVILAARNLALGQRAEDIARGVSVFHSRPSRDQFVSACRIPVTVVTGEDDPAPGVTHSTALAASAARGTLHVIPSCGHYVPLERPGALREILAGVIDANV